jgi:hypothetical protein
MILDQEFSLMPKPPNQIPLKPEPPFRLLPEKLQAFLGKFYDMEILRVEQEELASETPSDIETRQSTAMSRTNRYGQKLRALVSAELDAEFILNLVDPLKPGRSSRDPGSPIEAEVPLVEAYDKKEVELNSEDCSCNIPEDVKYTLEFGDEFRIRSEPSTHARFGHHLDPEHEDPDDEEASDDYMCSFHLVRYADYCGMVTKSGTHSKIIANLRRMHNDPAGPDNFRLNPMNFSLFKKSKSAEAVRRQVYLGHSNFKPYKEAFSEATNYY